MGHFSECGVVYKSHVDVIDLGQPVRLLSSQGNVPLSAMCLSALGWHVYALVKSGEIASSSAANRCLGIDMDPYSCRPSSLRALSDPCSNHLGAQRLLVRVISWQYMWCKSRESMHTDCFTGLL